MILDLNAIAPGLALASCALLLVVWVLCSRKLQGFVYCIAGWIMIYAMLHSDGRPQTLLGIAVAVSLLTALLMALWSILASRRRAARSRGPVYVPPAQRK